MTSVVWEKFFNEKCRAIFARGGTVLDIGEGLRARPDSGNKFDPTHAWMQELIAQVDYRVMDPVPDYGPDIVGDIHEIPLNDSSVDGMFCVAVLEHVEDPVRAMDEMYRVLKPGGQLLIYVPFLYYYHAHEGYYKDYRRYTKDAVAYLARNFSTYELIHVRDRLEMLVRLTPLGRYEWCIRCARWLDTRVDKQPKVQVGGYYVFLTK